MKQEGMEEDVSGDVISAGRGRLYHVLDSFQAKVVACLQGVQAIIDMGIGNAIVETDALLVVQGCTSTAYDLTLVGSLIFELRHAVSVYFLNVKFNSVPRSCYKVADALAALGSLCELDKDTVVSVLPDCIRTLVANDLAPNE
ncbi:hypothetical protein HU200_036755 [Digitaria exilis]|uniref:RNase H type-1 domain-containing protein n=1 Tax=Digitaria exilis TaxID=1010633 RepID=A0A835BEF8_9POAL|nr:hypothetical protein HU200_036755 [Digitaria exilis]